MTLQEEEKMSYSLLKYDCDSSALYTSVLLTICNSAKTQRVTG